MHLVYVTLRTRCLLFSLIVFALNEMSCRICVIHSVDNVNILLCIFCFYYIPNWDDMATYLGPLHKRKFMAIGNIIIS